MQIIRDFRPFPPVSTAGCAPCLHPPRRKCSFRRFWVHPPWRKHSFRRFLLFGRGGNAVFLIFCFSAAAEMIFLPFFTRPPWPKADFYRFLGFGHGRRAVFLVFRSSEASESRFFAKFHLPKTSAEYFSLSRGV